MKKYDVIVAGGGFSGVAAAAAAARNGCSVMLFESSGALGGAAVNNLVYPFMPYWTNIGEGEGKAKKYLSAGIFAELNQRYLELFPEGDFKRFNVEYMKVVLDRFLAECGVCVLFDTVLSSPAVEHGKITSVELVSKNGLMRFEAEYFIDATGDADLAFAAGCPFRLGRESDNLCQPMTLCFRAANINIELFRLEKPDMQRLYTEKQASGEITNPRENLLIFEGPGDGVLHFNTTRVVKLNPTDPFELSRAEAMAREQMLGVFQMLKNNFESFKDAVLLTSAPKIGVRESRMIDGLYTLTAKDLKALTRFEDSIAAGNYDIDIHSPDGSGTSHYYFSDGDYYTIPYRCLVPRGVDNLLVAGRCISADHEAQASIRIMPICCTLGEAAGTGAAVAFMNNTSVADADISDIRNRLTDAGAFI